MTDLSYPQSVDDTAARPGLHSLRLPLTILLAVGVAVLAAWLGVHFRGQADDAPLFAESTVGELAEWIADQSEEEAPESVLARYAKDRARQTGAESLAPVVLFDVMRSGVAVWCWVTAALAAAGAAGLLMHATWSRLALLGALIGMDTLLFVFPILEGDPTVPLIALGITLLLLALLFAPGRVTRVLGFFVALSVVLLAWEGIKAFADSVNYAITVPLDGWVYEEQPTVDDALAALQDGTLLALIHDERDLRDRVPPYPLREETPPADYEFPDLRLLNRVDGQETILGLPVRPDMPGRLTLVVRAEDAGSVNAIRQVRGAGLAAVSGSYAQENYLDTPRELVLVDLKIFNDLNLPHLQSIANAFLQPARRNGPLLLVRILWDAGLYTWGEALYGFLFGAVLGFLLGTLFAHSHLMERGLLPYVVASQTVPILAIAPMVVIWLGAGPLAVSVIAAYLTFFPVTINTLRGLRSPNPMALELMHSYAANRWTILWKLRFPAALPYIFTALKVSATASVVGAIIGELPSSIRDGLGRAILDFSSDYSPVSTPKLWAAIVMAAFVGITFFVIVTLVERIVLRGYVRSS